VAAIVCFYGAGVVLLREIAQRLRLSGWGIILLGVAYALVEEGLALQTIFNPVGPGDGESVYGRALGVNWFWGVVVSGYHVVWSVLIPIAVVHLVFARRSRTAWLSRPALLLFGVLFAVGTALFVLISHLRSDFRLSAVQIVAVLVAVGLLIWAASRCTARDRPWVPGRPPRPVLAALVAFGAGAVAEVKSGSRSWIRNRSPVMRSPRSMTRLRACCTVHAPVGCALTPARCSLRVPCSMKTSTCNCLSSTVSTIRKSHAMIAWA
jgi:hypothetical protein